MNHVWFKEYEAGVPQTIDINTYRSIPHLLETCFQKFGEKPNFTNMGKTYSFLDIDRESKKFAAFLTHRLGLKKGDRVALMMPNILQYPIALFGLLRAGLIAVNVNPLYTARELEHQLKDAEVSTIVIFANSAHILQKVLANTPVKHVILTEIGDLLGFPKKQLVNFVIKNVKKMVPEFHLPDAISFQEALELGDEKSFRPVELNHKDIAFLQYTGGTTGVAKGAILTHGNIIANMLQAKEWIKNLCREGEEIVITPLPLYHIFSLTANCFFFSSIGAHNILITNPKDIPGFIKGLKKWKFTAITGVNTLFNALMNNPSFSSLDFSYLKISLGGGMAVQKAVAEKWKKVTGRPLIEAYGLTETSPAACINPMTLAQFNGFIGLPIPSTTIEIKDDAGVAQGFNVVGEICIKGPQVMQGYWRRPDETEKVMTKDLFFRTGDLGFMTPQGYVKIVDRKKDMILVSGFNVYPNEVEDVLALHPKVLECAVIGVADDKSGEAIKAFIVKKDESLSEEEIIRHCRENLTSYKVPKHLEFRKELPKTNVGKILRKDLREEERKKTA
jgi:long-chain acyl-CoA synthetase